MIKQKLIDETIDLINPPDYDRKRLFEVLERRIGEDFKKNSLSTVHAKHYMNRDLTYILRGKIPRKYGELPENMGRFQRIAPSKYSDKLIT
jgi:tubulin polyglutamylase TTLL5